MPRTPPPPRWLLLVHQIPPTPAYLRVKIWRRLQRLGAVPVKNSVYALPSTEQAQEDFQWVVRAIEEGGGEAMVCQAQLVDGISDDQVEALFQTARDADYAQIVEEASAAARATEGARGRDAAAIRLARRLTDVVAIDFFEAPGRVAAEQAVAALSEREGRRASRAGGSLSPTELRGRVWVTRRGVHVDRMACAWLVRRFVDPKATFKFVGTRTYEPRRNEIRFDMFEAEFTHDGDRCTFEVLVDRLRLDDRALRPIAEIVHDIDLKDAKFGRPEVVGIDRLVTGIAMTHRDDEARLARGAATFEDLYGYFSRKRGG